jgi:D-glycero-D-manno-heptose 1,7-bisphosphate phosphatase
MMRPAVFLDRDGVINRALLRDGVPHPPASLTELEILPGVVDSLNALKARGYVLVVVTNQPDVARAKLSKEWVDDLHMRLRANLGLDAILTCFHDDADGCDCRKPRPGLILRAARELNIDLKSSFMVGDRWRDIEAGQRAGCRTFYIAAGYREKSPAVYDFRVTSLHAAADIVLGMAGPS